MKKWVGILLTTALASCGGESTSSPANLITKNDFESVEGWMGSPPSLTKDKAHSGTYSVVVRPGVDYSMGYDNLLGKMSASRPEKIKLSAWVFVPNAQVSTNLVVEVKEPSVPQALIWDGIALRKEVKKFNEWQLFEKVITIPAGAKATSSFKVYLWRLDSNQPVYMDDVTLTLANDAK